jgi:4-hydroxy-4-methyl-2-oxoglutarate aldolase
MNKIKMLRTHLQELAEYDTALLANLMPFVDDTPPHRWYMSSEIRSLLPDVGPTVGVAVTCELDTSTPDHEAGGNNDGFWQQLEQMEAIDAPTIWVVKCVGSRPQHECIMGDGMGKLLQAAGCVGTVTDGGLRDLAGLRSIGFAAYGTGITIHHCKIRVGKIDAPVDIGGITISPGDVIHANTEGVIRIPEQAVAKLADRAPAYRAFEHDAHQLFRRTDITSAQKRPLTNKILAKYGFNEHASTDSGANET